MLIKVGIRRILSFALTIDLIGSIKQIGKSDA